MMDRYKENIRCIKLDDFVNLDILAQIDDKKLYILGIDESSRYAAVFFLSHEIGIAGFIVSDDEYNEVKGIRFLNLPVLSVSKVDPCFWKSKIIIVSPTGNEDWFKVNCPDKVMILFSAGNLSDNVIIYGAGGMGDRLFNLLSALGIYVTCFVDKNPNKQGKLWSMGGCMLSHQRRQVEAAREIAA